jgi:hypothetical protein
VAPGKPGAVSLSTNRGVKPKGFFLNLDKPLCSICFVFIRKILFIMFVVSGEAANNKHNKIPG